mgnify:CR=1 FL=1
MIKKHVLLSILGLFIACTVGAQDNSLWSGVALSYHYYSDFQGAGKIPQQ